ncbi:hypothetical protein TKK_0019439 [Trichogramma kaykai]
MSAAGSFMPPMVIIPRVKPNEDFSVGKYPGSWQSSINQGGCSKISLPDGSKNNGSISHYEQMLHEINETEELVGLDATALSEEINDYEPIIHLPLRVFKNAVNAMQIFIIAANKFLPGHNLNATSAAIKQINFSSNDSINSRESSQESSSKVISVEPSTKTSDKPKARKKGKAAIITSKEYKTSLIDQKSRTIAKKPSENKSRKKLIHKKENSSESVLMEVESPSINYGNNINDVNYMNNGFRHFQVFSNNMDMNINCNEENIHPDICNYEC